MADDEYALLPRKEVSELETFLSKSKNTASHTGSGPQTPEMDQKLQDIISSTQSIL